MKAYGFCIPDGASGYDRKLDEMPNKKGIGLIVGNVLRSYKKKERRLGKEEIADQEADLEAEQFEEIVKNAE